MISLDLLPQEVKQKSCLVDEMLLDAPTIPADLVIQGARSTASLADKKQLGAAKISADLIPHLVWHQPAVKKEGSDGESLVP